MAKPRLLPLPEAATVLGLTVELLLDKIAAGEISAIDQPAGEPLILVADEPPPLSVQVDPVYAAGFLSRMHE